MDLTEREKEYLSNISLNLGEPGTWHEHRLPPAISPFDTHVVDCVESLGGRDASAIRSGVRIGVAALLKLGETISSSGYPFNYVLELQIEDSWFIRGETPPEISFVGSSCDDDVKKFFDCAIVSASQLDGGSLCAKCISVPMIVPLTCLLQSPNAIEIEDRYFFKAIYNSAFVVRQFESARSGINAGASHAMCRLFDILREGFDASNDSN